jgi:uncharacterized membrane protein YgcG
MVRYLKFLVAMMVTMFATSAMAFNPPPAPVVGSIVDQTGVLTQGEIRDLNMQLRQVNQSTDNMIGILIIPSPNGENMRDIGYATGKAWKVGHAGIDNGIMIVWARHNDRGGPGEVTIETGKGVEGDLPDLKCNDIIANVIRPQFKQRHFAGGLSAAIAAINTSIGDHRAALAEQRRHDELRQQQKVADNNVPATAGGGTTAPQASGGSGCDVSGIDHAGLGGGFLVWVALFLLVGFLVRRWYGKMVLQSARQRELERQQREQVRRAALDRLITAQQAHAQAEKERQQTIPTQVQSIPVVVVDTPTVPATPVIVPQPVIDPLATATATTATAVVAERVREEQEEIRREQEDDRRREKEREELRQFRLEEARQARADEEQRQERLARQQEEERAAAAAAAALAVAAETDDTDDSDDSGSLLSDIAGAVSSSDDDDSSSCSSSSGGGDIGGGGSDGSACSS